MVDKRAFSIPRRLIRKYGTRDPFIIAKALGIEVLFRNDFKRQKGAFKVVGNNSFIFINANLSHEMQMLVCAHESGHALLHRFLGLLPAGLLEFELFDITDQREYDANVFAATLQIDDNELLELALEGYDIVQIAKMMGTNVNLILIKVNEMNNNGHAFNIPYIPSRKFLSDIDDSPGHL